jgi:hypothetical protein
VLGPVILLGASGCSMVRVLGLVIISGHTANVKWGNVIVSGGGDELDVGSALAVPSLATNHYSTIWFFFNKYFQYIF